MTWWMRAMDRPKRLGPKKKMNCFSNSALIIIPNSKMLHPLCHTETPRCATVDTEDSPTSPRIAGARPRTRNSDILLKCMVRAIGEISSPTFPVRYSLVRQELQAAKRPLRKLSTSQLDQHGVDT